MSAEGDDQLAALLDAARTAHHVAYAEARRRGLDHLPPGAPDLGSLSEQQRDVVRAWQTAEAEYDRLRRLAHTQSHLNARPPSGGATGVERDGNRSGNG